MLYVTCFIEFIEAVIVQYCVNPIPHCAGTTYLWSKCEYEKEKLELLFQFVCVLNRKK